MMRTFSRWIAILALAAWVASAASETAGTRPSTQPAEVVSKPALYNAVPAPPRSPIPLPGESIMRPIGLAIVHPSRQGGSTTRPAPAPGAIRGELIPWSRAAEHMGETVTVEGRIVDTHNTGEVCFLNFVRNDRESFYLILWKDSFGSFPDSPERYFLDKTVRATGEVSENRGRPQLRIRNPNQIWVIE